MTTEFKIDVPANLIINANGIVRKLRFEECMTPGEIEKYLEICISLGICEHS